MRLEDALEGYWIAKRRDFSEHTISDYQLTFRRLQDFIGRDREIETITANDLNKFLNGLQIIREGNRPANDDEDDEEGEERKRSRKTLLNAWVALSSLWSWAEVELGIEQVVRGKVKKPKYRRRRVEPYTDDEIKALFEACDRMSTWHDPHGRPVNAQRATALRDKAIMLVMYDTGLRVSELAALKLKDYERKRGQLMIEHGKGDKKRVVYLGDTAKLAVWRYLKSRPQAKPEDYLFISRAGRPLDRTNIRMMIVRAGERAGVTRATPHRFRHSFAITFLRNGGSVMELQDLLGHEDMETVRIYARMAEVDLEKAQRRYSPADHLGVR